MYKVDTTHKVLQMYKFKIEKENLKRRLRHERSSSDRHASPIMLLAFYTRLYHFIFWAANLTYIAISFLIDISLS